MAQLIVEWSTDDPQLAEVLKLIAAYPEHSAERMELEATLHAAEAARLQRAAGERRGWASAGRAHQGARKAPSPPSA